MQKAKSKFLKNFLFLLSVLFIFSFVSCGGEHAIERIVHSSSSTTYKSVHIYQVKEINLLQTSDGKCYTSKNGSAVTYLNDDFSAYNSALYGGYESRYSMLSDFSDFDLTFSSRGVFVLSDAVLDSGDKLTFLLYLPRVDTSDGDGLYFWVTGHVKKECAAYHPIRSVPKNGETEIDIIDYFTFQESSFRSLREAKSAVKRVTVEFPKGNITIYYN